MNRKQKYQSLSTNSLWNSCELKNLEGRPERERLPSDSTALAWGTTQSPGSGPIGDLPRGEGVCTGPS
jgi:hypothetical protein